jgi:hypothetical protein
LPQANAPHEKVSFLTQFVLSVEFPRQLLIPNAPVPKVSTYQMINALNLQNARKTLLSTHCASYAFVTRKMNPSLTKNAKLAEQMNFSTESNASVKKDFTTMTLIV